MKMRFYGNLNVQLKIIMILIFNDCGSTDLSVSKCEIELAHEIIIARKSANYSRACIKIPCRIFLNIALTLSNKINSEKNSTQKQKRFSFLRISSSSSRIDLEPACREMKSPTQTTCAMSN